MLKVYANIPEDKIATQATKSYSKLLLGVTSPYPIVAIVIVAKYILKTYLVKIS